MKSFFIKTLFLLLCTFIATSIAFADDEFAYRHEIDKRLMQLFSQQDQCKALEEAIIVLNGEIKNNDDNIYLHKWRAQLSFAYSDFSTATNDIEAIIRQIPDDTEALMQRCILMEVQDMNDHSVLSCYADAVTVYREKIKNGTAQKNKDYIYALLMADMPEAQAEKEQYLAGLGHSQLDEADRKFFNSFDRTKAIPQYPRCPGSPQRAGTVPLTP